VLSQKNVPQPERFFDNHYNRRHTQTGVDTTLSFFVRAGLPAIATRPPRLACMAGVGRSGEAGAVARTKGLRPSARVCG
jgi:hypothetical protein